MFNSKIQPIKLKKTTLFYFSPPLVVIPAKAGISLHRPSSFLRKQESPYTFVKKIKI